jgi:hypothetical protein
MSALTILESVQFVVGKDGRPTAVQMGIETWNSLLDWLEDNEDRALVKAAIPKLRNGPQKAEALRWQEVRDEWSDVSPDESKQANEGR